MVAAGLLLLWLLVPTTEIVSPDWTVTVTDTAGHPIQGATVSVTSQQYTVESDATEETKVTDNNGQVSFAKREIHAIGFMRLWGVVRNLDQGVHASFGVHTWLFANKKGFGEPSRLALFRQNELNSLASGSARQTSHLVLMKCPDGYSGQGCSFPDDSTKPVLPLDTGH
jgi:hypothetical protein